MAELCLGIWKVAIFSAVVAAIPLPGLNVIYDLGLVSKQVRDYYTQLGPDETSLKRYAKLKSTDYHRLRSIVDRSLGCRVLSMKGFKEIVKAILKSEE